MGGKNSAPPPPDYSGIANASSEAAQLSFQLGREQLAWAREQYYKDREVVDGVVQKASNSLDRNDATAQADRARYEKTYQPLEDDLANDARSYATDERRDKDIGRAQATVATQFDQTRQAALQQLEGFGIDPSSTRYAALDIGTRAAKAAAMAAAGNQAAERVDAMGRALRSEAINVGRGYPGQVAAQYGTALNAGNQAVNSQLAATASGANTMGTAQGWTGTGNQSLGVWGNALTSGYNAQMAQYNANQNSSSGWGSALGLIGGIATKALPFSDERVKEDIEPVGKTNDGQTIYRFRYKGDPTPQIGLIAQEVEDKYPQAVKTDDQGLKHVDYDKAIHAAEGGPIEGGRMVPPGASPTRGKAIDDVPARLTVGEFVIPKEVVDYKGQEFFQNLIKKTRQAIDIDGGGNGDVPDKPARPAIMNAAPQMPTYQSRTGIPTR